jgi:hypothetical protein
MEPVENALLGKKVKIVKADGFVLYGTLLKKEDFGIWVKTNTETSFITFLNILEVRIDPRGG